MSERVARSQEYRIDVTFKLLVKQLMIELLGKDPKVCELCGAKPRDGCSIHHTKYEGATIFDLMFVCTRCNTQPENRYLA